MRVRVAPARSGSALKCVPQCGTMREGTNHIAESDGGQALPDEACTDADRHRYTRLSMADCISKSGWPRGRRARAWRSDAGLREAGGLRTREVLEPVRRSAKSGRTSSHRQPISGFGDSDQRSLEQSRNGTTSACGGSYLQEHARDRGRSITEVQATIDSSRTGTLCQIEPALAKAMARTREHIGADIHRGRAGLQPSTRTNGRAGKASSGTCPLVYFGKPRLPSPGQLGNRLFCRAGAGIRSFFIQPSSSNSRASATQCSAAS